MNALTLLPACGISPVTLAALLAWIWNASFAVGDLPGFAVAGLPGVASGACPERR